MGVCSPAYEEEVVEEVLGDEGVQGVLEELRGFCSEGEFLLEKAWAERLTSLPSSYTPAQGTYPLFSLPEKLKN